MEEKKQEVVIIGGHGNSAALRAAVEAAGLRARVENTVMVAGDFDETNEPDKEMLIAKRRAEIAHRREILDWNQKRENEKIAKQAAKPRKVRKNEFRKTALKARAFTR